MDMLHQILFLCLVHCNGLPLGPLTTLLSFTCHFVIKVRYCIYWENMPFIPSSKPKLPLSMEPSRGKMMKSDNPAPDSTLSHCNSLDTTWSSELVFDITQTGNMVGVDWLENGTGKWSKWHLMIIVILRLQLKTNYFENYNYISSACCNNWLTQF